MYANETTVRSLISNVKSEVTTAMITAAALVEEPMVDAKLKEAFYWPVGPDGTDLSSSPPDQVVSIASMLVAARIESRAYAHNEAGTAVANPYGRALRKDAIDMLDQAVSGTMDIIGLVRRQTVAVRTPQKVFALGRSTAFSKRNV